MTSRSRLFWLSLLAVLPIVGFVSRFLLLTSGVGDGSGFLANFLPFGLQIEEPYLRSMFVINRVDWTWHLHI